MSFNGLVYKCACVAMVTATLFMGACRQKDKTQTIDPPVASDHGSLTVKMSNEAGGVPITLGTTGYVNAAGNHYSVDLLKYYISNFTLIKSDNSEVNFGTHKLVNVEDSTSGTFTLDSVANGSYKAIRFYMGVDSAHNHSLVNDGDLNAGFGMIWAWSTGYIFFKHEGSFINDTGGVTNLVYHYGLDANLATVDIPVTQFDINANNKTMYLKFDLNRLYASPNTINFKNNNFHQSTDVSDRSWLGTMKANFPSAFTFDKVQ